MAAGARAAWYFLIRLHLVSRTCCTAATRWLSFYPGTPLPFADADIRRKGKRMANGCMYLILQCTVAEHRKTGESKKDEDEEGRRVLHRRVDDADERVREDGLAAMQHAQTFSVHARALSLPGCPLRPAITLNSLLSLETPLTSANLFHEQNAHRVDIDNFVSFLPSTSLPIFLLRFI